MAKTVEEVILEIDKMKEDGADAAAIGKFAKGSGYDVAALQQVFKEYKDTGEINIGGVGTSALQGLTFGFSEELGGIASALTGGDYDEYVTRQRNRMRLFEQQNPMLAGAAEMVGSLPSMLIPGAAAARGIQAASKMGPAASAALTAGIEGAVYGAGKGEGVEGTLEGTLTGAGLGAVTGGAGAKLASAVSRGGQRGAMTTEQRAAEELAARLPSDSTPVAMGPGGMIADTSEQAARYLRGIRSATPEASEAIDKAFNARFRAQHERLNAVVADAFDDIPEIASTIRKDLNLMKENAGVGYSKVYTEFMDMRSPDLANLIKSDIADYWDESVGALAKEAKANGDTVKFNAYKSLPKAKDLTEDSILPLEVVDLMKKNMYSDANPKGGTTTPMKGIEARALNANRVTMVNLADEATQGAYATTRKNFAEPAAMEEALNLGRKSIKDTNTSAVELREAFEGFENLQEKKAFTAGALQSLFMKIGQTGYSTDTVTALLKSPEAEAKLRAIIPNDAAWNRFKAAMAQEARQVRTKRLVTGGSNTADKLADKAAAETDIVENLASLFVDPGATLTGEVLAYLGNIARGLSYKLRTHADSRGLQAKMLTETDPKKKMEIAKQIAEARTNLGLRKEKADILGARVGGGTGAASVGLFSETETQGFERQ